MTSFVSQLDALSALKSNGRHRSPAARAGHDFVSNDYLGLAESDFLRDAAIVALECGVGVGSGGSRLLRGNTAEHELLEAEAAEFYKTERALFFGSGFAANTAIFSSLPGHDDLVIYDMLIHASAHDGMCLGRGEKIGFAHNDVVAVEATMFAWRSSGGTGRIWLAIESLYSMDGDLAPLAELMAVAKRHDAIVIVDEAHASGVFGDHGRGLAHQFSGANVLSLHACGKALGASGALVCGAAPLIDTLINRARGFIYATAPSPLSAAIVRSSLQGIEESDARQKALQKLVEFAHEQAEKHCGITGLQSQIIPVIIGDEDETMALASRMQQRGYDIRGIRPPSVPRGTSRLRISITLNTTTKIIEQMFTALGAEMKAL